MSSDYSANELILLSLSIFRLRSLLKRTAALFGDGNLYDRVYLSTKSNVSNMLSAYPTLRTSHSI